jgi:peptidoglycan biosynthesis protein MviN/MurJ (putative lipid II flippase)
MEEQLPIPLLELVLYNFYLGSVTYTLGLIGLWFYLKKKAVFSWPKFIVFSIVILLIGNTISIIIWHFWTIPIDIMLGPFHLPTVLALLLIALKVVWFRVLLAIYSG